MVNRRMETKEIARELGISPNGVNQRIKAAMRTLGVTKRRDAASLLALIEAGETGLLQYLPRKIVFEAFREEHASDVPADHLQTKLVRAPDGTSIELTVVRADSKSLSKDLLLAFRSNVRRVLESRKQADDPDNPPKA
jgi:hypothetical protein